MGFSFETGDDSKKMLEQGAALDRKRKKKLEDNLRHRSALYKSEKFSEEFLEAKRPETPESSLALPPIQSHKQGRKGKSKNKPKDKNKVQDPTSCDDSSGSVVTAVRDESRRNSLRRSIESARNIGNSRPRLDRNICSGQGKNDAIAAAASKYIPLFLASNSFICGVLC